MRIRDKFINNIFNRGDNMDKGNEHNETLQKYYDNLKPIKQFYQELTDKEFSNYLWQAINKAYERSIKFPIEDFEHYMNIATETYFKFFLSKPSDSLNVPATLYQGFMEIINLFNKYPELTQLKEEDKINFLSEIFSYPIFQTRLLYYSFKKWQANELRQVDIDLTVNLLPGPKRVKWEVIEKKTEEEINTIITKWLNKI